MTSSLSLLSDSLHATPTPSASAAAVTQTEKAGLARVATDLTIDASVVIAFGGSANSALTYNAAGLLNTLSQAGTVAAPPEVPEAGTSTESFVQQAMNQAIVGNLSTSPTSTGIYTADGSFQGLASASLSASWATILQSHPELAGTVVASSLAQGITRTLIASA